MLTLSSEEIIATIRNKSCFECYTDDHSLHIKVASFAPYIGTAIHNGSQFRPALVDICALTPAERYYEEDPVTSEFISSLPVTITALDSRYEYDLNRAPGDCIYDTAWGEKVWLEAVPDNELAHSLKKHFTYYSIFKAMAQTLEEMFGFCVVYDVHSYNYQRIDRETPVFNLGTHYIDKRKWRGETTELAALLSTVELPNTQVTVGIDDVFQGRGYQAQFCRSELSKTVCFPLEVKKIYMDERTGDGFPLVIEQLKEALKQVIFSHISAITSRKTRTRQITPKKLLGSAIPAELRLLDSSLFGLAKRLNTLSFINPVNLLAEKKRFLKRPYDYQPQFRYKQLDIDPYKFKEQLYSLPVHNIQDASIELLYKRVIEQLAMRIDLLTNIGNQGFLYNSLRYYGQPTQADLVNARFILHAREHDAEQGITLSGQQVLDLFDKRSKEYGIRCKIQGSDKIVAGAVVDGLNLRINVKKHFFHRELEGLIEHELGTHLVTSANANEQPLKIFKIGLPGNTHTQEGLAIMSEHLTGNISVARLKTLALRVICVDRMLQGVGFNELFFELKDKFGLGADTAFSMVTRVFRGGGFTKDHLYLSGLTHALRLAQTEDLTPLLVGKTSFEFLPLLKELLAREVIRPPRFVPNAFSTKTTREPIVDYLISSIH